jgi:hypothetical protein
MYLIREHLTVSSKAHFVGSFTSLNALLLYAIQHPMASFSAFLTVSGQFEIGVNAVAMEVFQSIDELGRPASPTSAGRITVTFNTTNDPFITGWMVSPTLQRSGQITFYALTGQIMKIIEFTNAFCVDMEEEFDGTATWMQMETTLVLSPETIRIGSIPHDNNWPPIESIRL